MWRSPVRDTKNQNDYVTFNKRFRNAIVHFKIYPNADCGSGHFPVVCYINVKLWRLKAKATPELQYDRLLKDSSCKEMYKNRVMNAYDLNENTKPKWEKQDHPKEKMNGRRNSGDDEKVTRDNAKEWKWIPNTKHRN